MNRLAKSTLPNSKPIGGMMIPSTSAVTIFSESGADNHRHRQINDITARDELAKFFQHLEVSFGQTGLSIFRLAFCGPSDLSVRRLDRALETGPARRKTSACTRRAGPVTLFAIRYNNEQRSGDGA